MKAEESTSKRDTTVNTITLTAGHALTGPVVHQHYDKDVLVSMTPGEVTALVRPLGNIGIGIEKGQPFGWAKQAVMLQIASDPRNKV